MEQLEEEKEEKQEWQYLHQELGQELKQYYQQQWKLRLLLLEEEEEKQWGAWREEQCSSAVAVSELRLPACARGPFRIRRRNSRTCPSEFPSESFTMC